MKMTFNVRVCVGAAMVAAAGLLGACSAHVEAGKPSGVDKDKLADVVKQQIEAKAKAKTESVVCDGSLPAEVGATQRCVVTVDSEKYSATVTAKSVDDGKVKFGVQIDDKPMG